jgi:hypothetical protein
MRVRIHDTEVAAAFMGLARLRPDVVLAPASAGGRSSGGSGHNLFDVGLLGSFRSEERTTEVASLVRGWTTELRGRFREVGVEIVS